MPGIQGRTEPDKKQALYGLSPLLKQGCTGRRVYGIIRGINARTGEMNPPCAAVSLPASPQPRNRG